MALPLNMFRHLGRLVLFVAALAILQALVERAALPLWPDAIGPGTLQRIEMGFAGATERTYSCLVVGNSRIYRGVNPDRLGISAYNFGQDDDAFNQVYYKLIYARTNGARFETLIMGVDYFQFSFLSDRRHLAYARYFPPEYLADFPKPATGVLQRVLHPVDEDSFNGFMIRHFTRPASLLLDWGLGRLLGGDPPPPIRAYLRDNGQYILEAPPAQVVPAERDATRLPVQVRYFEASLDWARQQEVRVFVVMPPLRQAERDAYAPAVTAEFDQWIQQRATAYGATYLDFAAHPAFTDRDFSDFTHLTTAAADRFSAMVGNALKVSGAP